MKTCIRFCTYKRYHPCSAHAHFPSYSGHVHVSEEHSYILFHWNSTPRTGNRRKNKFFFRILLTALQYSVLTAVIRVKQKPEHHCFNKCYLKHSQYQQSTHKSDIIERSVTFLLADHPPPPVLASNVNHGSSHSSSRKYGCPGDRNPKFKIYMYIYMHNWSTIYYAARNYVSLHVSTADRGSSVVNVLCYKSEDRWLDLSWCQWIFHWHNPSDRTMALRSTQPLTEMSTRSISWG